MRCLVLLAVVVSTLIASAISTLAISSEPSNDLVLTDYEKSWIAEHPVINIRVSSSYPPFEFYDNGSYQGLAYDYLTILGQRLGLTFKPVEEMAWGEALQRIKDKEGVDLVVLITHTQDRESFLNFTRDYISFPEVIFTREGGLFVSGFKDLEGRLVATENDFIEAETLRQDIKDVKLLEVKTTAEALKAVALGDADAYVGNLGVGSYLIDKLGLVNLKVAAPTPYGDDSYAMGIRKDWPELARILEKGLDSLNAEEHQGVRQKWLAIRYEYGLSAIDIIKWVLVAVVISLVFIIQLRLMVQARTRELRDSQNLLQAIQDNAFQFTGLLTPDGKVCAVNQTTLEFTGSSKNDFVGKFIWDSPLWTYSNESHREKLKHSVNRAALGEVVRYEAIYNNPSDNTKYFDFTLKPVRNNSGEIIYLVPSGHDITDVKEMQAKSIHKSQLASMGELAAGVAHEINNPMTGVINYTQLLLNRVGSDPSNKDILDRLMKEANRVTTIVKGLLSIAHDDRTGFASISIRDALEDALSLIQSQVNKDGIILEVSCDEKLPLINGSLQQMVQVFLNLISNARHTLNEKFPQTDSEKKINISLSAVSENSERIVRITVRDKGAGIRDEVLDRVFRPFVTTKPAGEGTGLGLSITKDIIDNHNGTISVDTEVGKYTEFTINIPAKNG